MKLRSGLNTARQIPPSTTTRPIQPQTTTAQARETLQAQSTTNLPPNPTPQADTYIFDPINSAPKEIQKAFSTPIFEHRLGLNNKNLSRLPRHHFANKLLSSPEPSNPLSKLPIELVYRILEFLQPHEYAGLACCCHWTLQLTNAAVQREKPGCAERYSLFVSYTGMCGALLEVERRLREYWWAPACSGLRDLPAGSDDEDDL